MLQRNAPCTIAHCMHHSTWRPIVLLSVEQAPKQPAAKAQAVQAAVGKRKRQSDGTAANPQPAAKRQAASSGPSGAGAILQRRQSAAATGHGTGGPPAAAAAPLGSRQPGRMGGAARPVPDPTHTSSAGQGGRRGIRPHYVPKNVRAGWQQQQQQQQNRMARSAPQWRPQQQRLPPPEAPTHQSPAWPRQAPQGMAFDGAAMPTDPTGSQMPPHDQQGPFAEAAGPGHAFSRGHMRPPPQQQHMGHWHPRPQGQHIRFPDDDWSPPMQQDQQQPFRHSSQMGLPQYPWEPPQHQPQQQQQQQQQPVMMAQLQQQQGHMQHEHQRQEPPLWQRHVEHPDWQPPQHDVAPDWQPPMQLPHASGWHGFADHPGPGMRPPGWR